MFNPDLIEQIPGGKCFRHNAPDYFIWELNHQTTAWQHPIYILWEYEVYLYQWYKKDLIYLICDTIIQTTTTYLHTESVKFTCSNYIKNIQPWFTWTVAALPSKCSRHNAPARQLLSLEFNPFSCMFCQNPGFFEKFWISKTILKTVTYYESMYITKTINDLHTESM